MAETYSRIYIDDDLKKFYEIEGEAAAGFGGFQPPPVFFSSFGGRQDP